MDVSDIRDPDLRGIVECNLTKWEKEKLLNIRCEELEEEMKAARELIEK